MKVKKNIYLDIITLNDKMMINLILPIEKNETKLHSVP